MVQDFSSEKADYASLTPASRQDQFADITDSVQWCAEPRQPSLDPTLMVQPMQQCRLNEVCVSYTHIFPAHGANRG